MRLGTVRVGDLVRLDDGMIFFVVARDGPQARCLHVNRPAITRTVTGRQVIEHWRKRAAS